LEAQDKMLATGKQVDHEKLRRVSHKSTRIARHFARMMGKADSFALTHEVKIARRKSSSDETVTTKTSTTSRTAAVDDSSFSCSTGDHDLSPMGKDSHHVHKMTNRFRRFGFGGRRNSDSSKSSTKEATSRVSRHM
jgi:hypothetical protein